MLHLVHTHIQCRYLGAYFIDRLQQMLCRDRVISGEVGHIGGTDLSTHAPLPCLKLMLEAVQRLPQPLHGERLIA
ncbi:MAG: hypothetical protein HC875_05635 [Anaerolineales bacterium]|nr:hypothetical protein [Anaerolineales bacterium]